MECTHDTGSFFDGLRKFLIAVVVFFARLIRDMGLEVWKPIRRLVVKWRPMVIAGLLFLWFVSSDPNWAEALATFVLAIVALIFGLRMLLEDSRKKEKAEVMKESSASDKGLP